MKKLCLIILMCMMTLPVLAQEVTVSESKETFTTYPFSDPDPVPRFGRIYPYYKFDGYSHTSQKQPWSVVRMANKYIEVTVTPGIGGKVWGAVEKSSGHEFVYFNKVVKFRNIAMRGPWTSGGIEYNFGAIGHAPSTSTPVHYLWRRTPGGVECIAGGMDLPSRSQWRVAIRVPKEKAFFETQCSWFNPTPLHHSYYHWMNAAAESRDDLQFCYPGNRYIGHDGSSHPWPAKVMDGKEVDLSYYKNNRFGPHKSYHVLGEFCEAFGGYYGEKKFGFGNWSLYDDKPGKKLWLWAQSRQGAIWEDLLTDKGNRQYVEYQSGRMLSQADDKSSLTPYKHAYFAPYAFDRWSETWFPFLGTGGMKTASPYGVVNTVRDTGAGTVTLHMCPLQPLEGKLTVTAAGETVLEEQVKLSPMVLFSKTLQVGNLDGETEIFVDLGGGKLGYSSVQHETNRTGKHFEPVTIDAGSAEGLFLGAEEAARQREYGKSMGLLAQCIEKQSNHLRARVLLAELYYRNMQDKKAIMHAEEVLKIDIYHAGANFIYGLAHLQQGRLTAAREAFGWAARDMGFRSAAYTELARTYLLESNPRRALLYAQRALDFNAYNLSALQEMAVCQRLLNRPGEAATLLKRILHIDPLSHFARFEGFLLNPDEKSKTHFTGLIRNELPQETYLELATVYVGMGRDNDAFKLLQSAPPDHAMVLYWLAYLSRESGKDQSKSYIQKALEATPFLVFPFRRETAKVLTWALEQAPHWKTRYYRALVYRHMNMATEAGKLLADCGNEPGYAPFYMARANLYKELNKNSREIPADYQRALALAPGDWRTGHTLALYYRQINRGDLAEKTARKAYRNFKDNYIIALTYAAELLHNKKFRRCLQVLSQTRVLPYEGAREGRNIYRRANLGKARRLMGKKEFKKALTYIRAAKEWPENLGVGKPYNPDQKEEEALEKECLR